MRNDMTPFYIGLIIGCLIGGFLGIIIAGLCKMASEKADGIVPTHWNGI